MPGFIPSLSMDDIVSLKGKPYSKSPCWLRNLFLLVSLTPLLSGRSWTTSTYTVSS